MTGSTWESAEGRPRDRSDSMEPWDERNGDETPAAVLPVAGAGTATNTTNTGTPSSSNNNDDSMRRDPYTTTNNNKYQAEEEELEDGDLPRLNLSRSNSNGNRAMSVMSRNNASVTSSAHENIRRMAGGTEELMKQQAFWKQLDSPSTVTEDDANMDSNGMKRKRRFEKAPLAPPPTLGASAAAAQATPISPIEGMEDRRTNVPQQSVVPPPLEAREDTKPREQQFRSSKSRKKDPQLRRAQSEESDDTRDSKEYVEPEVEETNFCDHTLSAMEAICADAGLGAFCGGGTNTTTDKVTISNQHDSRNEAGNRRKHAKNKNLLLSARDENDSVDEHTAIEVEYVEPEETSAVAQERPENWSPTRKNAYLAAMARKAKEDFEKSQANEMAPTSAKRTTKAVNNSATETAAQDVYNSFNAAEKRKFLRLINSGMTPTESAQRVHAEREKSKDTKPSKKGKFLKFWKKAKSKAAAISAPSEQEKQPHIDRDPAGFPVEGSYPQEEKKEDDRQPPAHPGAAMAHQKGATSESASTSEDTTGVNSQESPSQSQSHSQSNSDQQQGDSESDASSAPRQKPAQSLVVVDNSGQHAEKPTSDRLLQQVRRASPERRTPGLVSQQMQRSSPGRPAPGSAAQAAVPDTTEDQDPKNLSLSLETRQDSRDGFAKSGINYYDAVRRDLSESEEETEFSNQVSVSSKSRSKPRLGPILQSPKLQGFSKLTKAGSKANRVIEKYASPNDSASRGERERNAELMGQSPGINEEPPSPEEAKTEVDAIVQNHSRDFSFTENVTEYGTANFDVPVRSSTDSLNSSTEAPSKAEEEALERIEKELLRPVRNIPSLGSTSTAARAGVVTPDTVAKGTTPRSQKSAEKLRDQIVAVVSPQGTPETSTPDAHQASTPNKDESKGVSSAAPSLASTAVLTPPSTQASHATHPYAARADSLPSPAKLSPILASAATTPPASSPAVKVSSMERTLDDVDFDMQEYLNSTEIYSQAGQVNDSMSIVSGRSFTTADNGGSVYTQGSTLTQSSRKRRPGAAKTRLAKAKEAEKQAQKKKGWHESIQAAAESTNRVWKPKVGWVDYTDEIAGNNTADLSTSFASTERMHLNLSVGKEKRQEEAPGSYRSDQNGAYGAVSAVGQDSEQQDEQAVRYVSPTPSEPEGELAAMPNQEPEISYMAEEQNNGFALYQPNGKLESRQPRQPEKPSQFSVVANSEGAAKPTSLSSRFDANNHEVPAEKADTSWLETTHSNQPPDEKRQGPSTDLSADLSYPSLDEKPRNKVTHLSVDTSLPALDESYLDVPPAPEGLHPHSLGTSDTQTTPDKPLAISLDDMSVDESIAHSVDQFVQSIGAASPSRSGRKKTGASSPNRAKKFANSPTKRTGWVDSMRAASANIRKEGQSWDPATGWSLSDSAITRSPLNEDFAPPSTRFEQETIEERQTEASERSDRLDSDASQDSAEVEPNLTKLSKDPLPKKDKPQESASSIPPKNPTEQVDRIGFVASPAQSPVEGSRDGKSKREHSFSPGGFPVDNLNITPTVNVVKEKVDEEDLNWFPQSRRSSSMVVIPESPEEMSNSDKQTSEEPPPKSAKKSPGPTSVQIERLQVERLTENNERDGVVWNGVVFESGSYSQSASPTGHTGQAAHAKAEKPTKTVAPTQDVATGWENRADASKSGSSISSKSSFTKKVPKLSQPKRDTSPIRAIKVRAESSRQEVLVDRESEEKAQAMPPSKSSLQPNVGSARTSPQPAGVGQTDSSTRIPNVGEESTSGVAAFSEGEKARASRSVWRNANSTASSSSSPKRIPITTGKPQAVQARPTLESPSRPNGVGWPDEGEEEDDGDDRYFSRDQGAFPSALDPPSSPGSTSSSVRQRAQQWESRTPKEPLYQHEHHRPPGSGRLNAATAEWKSFLGKKQRAEYNVQNDSLFDFSVTDGSVDSRVRSPDNVPEGQPVPPQFQQRGVPARHAEDRRPQSHPDRPQAEPIREEAHRAPSEASDYSDGNEVNKPFLARLAGCAAPMMRKGSQQGSDALAHLAFLRTNPQDGKHGSSRFMPQYLCGRPDVILEEAGETEEGNDPGVEGKKVTTEREEKVVAEQQAKPLKNVKGNSEVRADTRSVISEDFGAKTAYLEALAMKTAVSKPRRSDSRRRDRSSASSDVSSSSSKMQQKEKWRDFLERKSKAGASPGKSRAGSDTTSAAENYAAQKVEEMMAHMASRSKSTPRNFRSPDDPETSKSLFVESAIREHTRVAYQTESGQMKRTDAYRSDSLVAAEQLASARVNAMMQALATDSPSAMEEGEI